MKNLLRIFGSCICAFLLSAGVVQAGDDGKDIKDVAAASEDPAYGPWHFDIKGLFLQRDTLAGNQPVVLFNNGNNTWAVAKTTDDVELDSSMKGTAQFTTAYDLNDTDSVEASYFGFGTLRWSESSQILDPNGNLDVIIPDITNDFDGADRVTLRQRSRLNHNVELSFKKELPDVCENFDVFAGFRYVNLDESFEIRAQDGNNEGVYTIQTGNNLVGLQIGVDWSYPICDEVSVAFTGKAGPYANFADHSTHLADNNNSTIIRGFETEQVVPSFVGETGLMLVFFLDDAKAFRISAGYQALFMTGLAMAQDQINLDGEIGPIGTDTNDIAINGSVVFHGVVASVSFPWIGEWDLPQSLND
jgi:hypothetical protein